jgi:hypothetical protein
MGRLDNGVQPSLRDRKEGGSDSIPVPWTTGHNQCVTGLDIQEALLFLPRTVRGRDPIHLRQLQPLAAVLDWEQQRHLWRRLQAKRGLDLPE